MDSIVKIGFKRSCAQVLAKRTLLSPYILGRQLQALRFKGGRNDCTSPDTEPRCSPAKLSSSPCAKRKKKEKAASDKNKSPFKSMWINPECCRDPCPDLLPRFDELYYRPSDKAKRKYQRTWNKCPKRKIMPKVMCNWEDFKISPLKNKRKSCDKRPDTACVPEGCGKKKSSEQKCATIGLPGCRPGRLPPKCHVVRVPTPCTKVCCPYPAFSECKRDPLKKGRNTECDCLRSRSACSLFDYLRRQQQQKSAKRK